MKPMAMSEREKTSQGSEIRHAPASAPTARQGPFWAWVGAHGGAGTTTLAQAVPGGADLGRRLPLEEGMTGLPAVIVCRGNARGLGAARDTAAMASSTTTLLGLVVVADMPERRRPKILADSLYVTAGETSTWHLALSPLSLVEFRLDLRTGRPWCHLLKALLHMVSIVTVKLTVVLCLRLVHQTFLIWL